jgi:hypothetical protein
MYAQVEKSKENKSMAVANSVAHNKSCVKQGLGFEDNRLSTKKAHLLQMNILSHEESTSHSLLGNNGKNGCTRPLLDKSVRQRQVYIENETADGYNLVSAEDIANAMRRKGYSPEQIPLMGGVIAFYNDQDRHEFSEIEHVVPRINKELQDRYIGAAGLAAPTIMAILDSVHEIAFAFFLRIAGYDPTLLIDLLYRATQNAHIKTESVNRTFNSIIKPLNSGFSTSIKEANIDKMKTGKIGEFKGLEGELKAALSMPVPGNGNQVIMGEMLDIDDEGGVDCHIDLTGIV